MTNPPYVAVVASCEKYYLYCPFVALNMRTTLFQEHHMKKILTAVAIVAGFVGTASAAEWQSSLELGYVQTSGNTDTSSMNTKGRAVRDGEAWRTTVQAAALSATDTGNTIAEKYNLSAQGDWKIGGASFLFARIGFDTDRFGGFKSRTSETTGYGFDILKDSERQWNAEIGAGARQTKLTTGTKTSDAVLRVATLYNWKISDTATFSQELRIEGGKQGYVSNAVTSLLNQVSGNLSSKVSFSAQHTSKVPTGTKKLNKEVAASLVFTY